MTRAVTEMDREAGRRLKARRERMNVSQAELAELLGVSFQQVQKYEHGNNRIPAKKLYFAAQRLDVPMEYFYRPAIVVDTEDT